MVWRLRRAQSHFSPPVRIMEELHCVSRSTTSTRCSPMSAKPCASIVVTVDLPTPPLRLATARRMPIPPYLQEHSAWDYANPSLNVPFKTAHGGYQCSSPRVSLRVSLKQAVAVNGGVALSC